MAGKCSPTRFGEHGPHLPDWLARNVFSLRRWPCAPFLSSISGYTGLTSEYTQIRERLGPFDLVMLEVGAFHPSWGDIHLGPENALKAHTLLGGGAFLPVHWGTFSLALHDWDQPAEVLFEQASRD
jgi:hypothetical protein